MPHSTTHDVYWRLTEPAVRRALSLQDRNPASATFGCCDRSFWQYKTISSFAAATMQQLALPFAVLHSARFDGNPWYGDDEMFERARSAMLFWAASQHDGVYDLRHRRCLRAPAGAIGTRGFRAHSRRIVARRGVADAPVQR